jgi:hypothetical protein
MNATYQLAVRPTGVAFQLVVQPAPRQRGVRRSAVDARRLDSTWRRVSAAEGVGASAVEHIDLR